MKIARKILLFASLFALTGCQSTTTEEGGNLIMKEILTDTSFKSGFDLMTTSTLNGRAFAAYLNYGGDATNQEDSPHPWQMSQWWTPYDFKDATFSKSADGVYEYTNESRHIKVDTNNGELTLDLNSNIEYQKLFGHSRNGDENWSHILIEQNIKNCPKLFNLENVFVELEFCINKCENLDPDQNVPAAQLLWYFTITDPKNGNTDYESEVDGKTNQFMWFGIPLYDSRYDYVEQYVNVDSGFVGATNRVIYCISSRNYFSEKIQFGKTYSIYLDILPFIKQAYVYGLNHDAMENINYDDLVLNYMNFGWELPGSFDASATIKKISTKIIEKENLR